MLTQPPLDQTVTYALDQPVTALAPARVLDVHGFDTLRRAASLLADNQVGVLVVRRGTLAAGVISERDLVRAAAEGLDLDDTRVDEVMTEDLAGVQGEATIREAACIMATNGIRHLVVRSESRIEGVVSARDILAVVGQAG